MNTVQLKEAKAKLSELVEAAERGEPTTITRDGKPAAMIVPFEQQQETGPGKKSFAWLPLDPGTHPCET